MTEQEHMPGSTEQAARPQVLVVAGDPQLRKWLRMALSLEFACEIHTADSADKAEAADTRLTPALVIVDEQL